MAPRIVLVFLFIFTGLRQRAAASDTLVIQKMADLDSISLADHAAFFEDWSGKMSWQEAAHQAFKPFQRPLQWFDTAYGRRRITVWFRITLQNGMDDSAQIALLFRHYAFFREVVIISPDDTVIRRPDYFFTSTRKTGRANIVVAAAPGENLTYFIGVYNPYDNTSRMTIRSVQAYNEWSERFYNRWFTNYMAKIIFLAIIGFISLHTLAQYLIHRRREFVRYAFYSTSVFFLFLANLEYQLYFDVIFSFFPYIQKYVYSPLFMLVFYMYFRFAREYVNFKSLSPWFYRLIILTERLILSMIIVYLMLDTVFNKYDLANQLFVGTRMFLFSVSFAAVFLLLRSGKKELYFFGVGALMLTVGVVFAMLFSFFPDINPIPQMEHIWYFELGIVLELLCFAAGLSYKTRLIEVEKRNTQQQLIRQLEENRSLQEELNAKLQVRARQLTEQVMTQQHDLEKEKEQQLMLEFTRKITEMELQLLKSQLNPHFYFNTLNNLYGLAMIAPKKAPDGILKLSDIMEYVIYDCRHDKVPLAKEIKFLRSYIELEKLRYDDNVRISINVAGRSDNRSISPMLLIQFVENAFKHGIQKEKPNSYLHIDINVHNGSLKYESANSIHGQAWKSSGVGLTNVRKRLDLLYPQKHVLQLITGEHEFRVKLQLTLL